MELSIAIVLTFGLAFVSILGYKAFQSFNKTELAKEATHHNTAHALEIKEREDLIKKLMNSNRNYEYKIKKLRNGDYDLEFEDEEIPEGLDDDGSSLELSELAKIVYPKLPDGIAKLIDKEEFQSAIMKTVEKKPDIITNFIDKYLNKPVDQGSSSNTLQEKYL